MYKYPVAVEVEELPVGVPLREYPHAGKRYVAGCMGVSYQLRLKNHSHRRLLAVCTVDGLSVMDGQPGDMQGSGYVIPACGSLVIPGWRLSQNRVAQFVFQDKAQSYAVQTSRGADVGVIGVAAFFEETIRALTWVSSWSWRPYTVSPYPPSSVTGTSDSLTNLCCTTSSPGTEPSTSIYTVTAQQMADAEAAGMLTPTQTLGTGFGPSVDHRVTDTSFRRPSAPAAVLTLYYDTRDNLRARGILVDAPAAESAPRAFPADRQYCAPPAGWPG